MTNPHRNIAIQWLQNRVRTDRFSGLTLSILFLVFSLISFHLASLVEDVVTSDAIVYLDHHFAAYLATIRTHRLVEFFLIFTFLGQPLLIGWGLILSVVGLFWTRLTIWIIPLFVSVMTSLLLVYLGKYVIARPRPEESLFSMHSFSFPSGHSTIAISFYGFVGLIFVLEMQKISTRVILSLLTFVIVVLVLLSRMVLGVHYFSDVIGGLLVGGMAVTLGLSVYFWQKFSIQKTEKSNINIIRYWKVMVLITLFFIGWVGFEVFGEHTLYQDQLAK